MFEINHEEIGRRIRERRQRMGFSQEMLANLVGVHHSKISRLESGKLEPRFDLMSKVSYFLQISIDDLLEFGPLMSVAYTRRDRRPRIVLEPYELHALALQKKDNELNPFYLIVTQTQKSEDPGEIADRSDIRIFQHPGEEFLFVEDGVIIVYFAEKTDTGHKLIIDHPELFPITLHPGDSVCFDADIPHTYVTVSEPQSIALDTVQLSSEDLDRLDAARKANPESDIRSLIREIKRGAKARAVVVCSAMSIGPEELRTLKERFYNPPRR